MKFITIISKQNIELAINQSSLRGSGFLAGSVCSANGNGVVVGSVARNATGKKPSTINNAMVYRI